MFRKLVIKSYILKHFQGNYDLNDTDATSVNITVGLISENSAQRLKVSNEFIIKSLKSSRFYYFI